MCEACVVMSNVYKQPVISHLTVGERGVTGLLCQPVPTLHCITSKLLCVCADLNHLNWGRCWRGPRLSLRWH